MDALRVDCAPLSHEIVIPGSLRNHDAKLNIATETSTSLIRAISKIVKRARPGPIPELISGYIVVPAAFVGKRN